MIRRENELEARLKVIVFCFIHQQNKEVKTVDKIRVKPNRINMEQRLKKAFALVRYFAKPDLIGDSSSG